MDRPRPAGGQAFLSRPNENLFLYERLIVMLERSPVSKLFPQRLRAARELRELNQVQLASRANLQASAISHFETGLRKPSFDNLKRLADALDVTTDYLLARVDDPAGFGSAERIHRHLGQLTGSDRKTAEEMIEILAMRAQRRSRRRRVTMVGRSRGAMAAREAERLIAELGIKDLPVDPRAIARSLGIEVRPKRAKDGVSGMLIRLGNEFGIAYATHIKNEGFRRFCIAHEIGHYRIPGHVDAVLAHGDTHESRAGFVNADRYEREADRFAASLLMPDDLFIKEMRLVGDGLRAIEALAGRCNTSLLAAAIRYVQKSEVPVAMIVSTGSQVDYCFVSGPLRHFELLDYPRKGSPLPPGSRTEEFNSEPENIRAAQRTEAEVDLRLWFGGRREMPGTEAVVGLGRYGKTLTILCSDTLANDEDEEFELQKSENPLSRR